MLPSEVKRSLGASGSSCISYNSAELLKLSTAVIDDRFMLDQLLVGLNSATERSLSLLSAAAADQERRGLRRCIKERRLAAVD